MSKKVRKGNPVRTVTILTVVFLLLGAGCFVGSRYLTSYRASLLQSRVDEVEAINQERDQEYAVALAEYESENDTGVNTAWPAQKTEGWDILDLTNYPLESPGSVTMTRQDCMYNGMLLVNQWHSRPDDFDDSNVVSVANYTKWAVGVSGSGVKLFSVAIEAWENALADAAAQGYDYYIISEGYRSWDDQNALFQKQMDSLSNKYSGDALIEQAKKSVNYPGTSEFNTGLAFTVRLYKKGDAEINALDYTTCDAGIWMSENSWKYGLIFRFPLADYPMKGTSDKSYKTGISSKLRLLRYVGEGNATVMHVLDLCLEEYVEYLMEHPHIAVFEDGVLKYEIYRQEVGDADTFDVEITRKSRSYTSSLDNMGGLITVFEY